MKQLIITLICIAIGVSCKQPRRYNESEGGRPMWAENPAMDSIPGHFRELPKELK